MYDQRSGGHRSGGHRSGGKRSHGHRSGGNRKRSRSKNAHGSYQGNGGYGSQEGYYGSQGGGYGPPMGGPPMEGPPPMGGAPIGGPGYGTMSEPPQGPPQGRYIGSGYWGAQQQQQMAFGGKQPPPGWAPLGPEGMPPGTEAPQTAKDVWIFLWLLGSAAAFKANYDYWIQKEVLYQTLGNGLTMARGPAAVLYVNTGLVVLLVCRNLIRYLRNTWVNGVIPFDKNITWHKKAGWMIAAMSAMHATSHYFNMYVISQIGADGQAPPAGLPDALQFEPGKTPSLLTIAFLSIPGLTGHIILACMALMFTSAWKKNKTQQNGNFELFWYIHQLWVVYFAAYLVHGTGGLLGEPAKAWIFAAGPLGIYTLERLLRLSRASQSIHIVKVVMHPAKVVEIHFTQRGLSYKAGHYLFMCCPFVSRMQWHPFTISSGPEEPFVSVHIREAGDWTRRLHQVLVPSLREKDKDGFYPEINGSRVIQVDGPFGASSEEWSDYEVSVLVGAGVGVTPFASILKSINARVRGLGERIRMKKVYFFWICKEYGTFQWFKKLLDSLEQQGIDNFLEIHIHVTVKFTDDEVMRIAIGANDNAKDTVTGLRAPTYFGRPEWPKIFYDLYKKHPGDKVGVFCCGPSALSKDLRARCAQFSDSFTQFEFHKENFVRLLFLPIPVVCPALSFSPCCLSVCVSGSSLSRCFLANAHGYPVITPVICRSDLSECVLCFSTYPAVVSVRCMHGGVLIVVFSFLSPSPSTL